MPYKFFFEVHWKNSDSRKIKFWTIWNCLTLLQQNLTEKCEVYTLCLHCSIVWSNILWWTELSPKPAWILKGSQYIHSAVGRMKISCFFFLQLIMNKCTKLFANKLFKRPQKYKKAINYYVSNKRKGFILLEVFQVAKLWWDLIETRELKPLRTVQPWFPVADSTVLKNCID